MATFKARFFDPMLLLRTQRLPEGADWLYEVKLDGYRAIAFKTDRKIHLRSRNDNDFAVRYPSIVEALRLLPKETVVDGELVALDANGKPSFNNASELWLIERVSALLPLRCSDVEWQEVDRRAFKRAQGGLRERDSADAS